jgi:iron(III) transport system ATP-binding protein
MNPVGVEILNVALAYGATPVLRDISLAVAPGEFFALLGPSGSGKSTLLRLIAGFNRQQSGTVTIGGRDVGEVPPWKRDVGMVFQNYALWPHMTSSATWPSGSRSGGLPRDEVRRRVAATLDLVGLADYGARRPGQLSGGKQQRVALGPARSPSSPRCCFSTSRSPTWTRSCACRCASELRRMHASARDHDHLRDARPGRGAHHVRPDRRDGRGRDPAGGHAHELFDHPANRFVAQFVGSVNLFEGAIRRAGQRWIFASPVLGEVGLPEALCPRREGARRDRLPPACVALGAPALADSLELDGVVEGGEFLGEFMRYEVKVGAALVIADLPHRRGAPRLPDGGTREARRSFHRSPDDVT